MRLMRIILALALLAVSSSPTHAAEPRVHRVAQGHTLGGIARRYHVSIDAICTANGIQRNQPIRIGQRLIVPAKDDQDGRRAAQARLRGEFRPKSSRRSTRPGQPRIHVVAKGQTLGGIARRYRVSVDAICTANGVQRNRPIRTEQRLIIPAPHDRDGRGAAQARLRNASSAARRSKVSGAAPQVLKIPAAPPVYYYSPIGPGRLTLRPVIFYLHGGGGDPKSDCQRWAPVGRRRGWLVCPTGAARRADGRPIWGNWVSAKRIVTAALKTLRAKYGRRVQLYGNTLIGFSEGALAAMNIGVRYARTFNRWLVVASTDAYWAGPGLEALQRNRRRIRRVYLVTGEHDGTLEGTRRVLRQLQRARVATKLHELKGYGHEVPLRSRGWLFEAALKWLDSGGRAPS